MPAPTERRPARHPARGIQPRSEQIDELAALERRLTLEHTSALVAMTKQPPGLQLALAELSRIADIYTVLQAVRSELSMRQPHEGWSRP